MSESSRPPSPPPLPKQVVADASQPAAVAESTERWVGGKGERELLSDLKVYLARLRDDPHSLQDRLRVAAIQLRLGRVDESLIHYEGVLKGYAASGQIPSAIALCQRILQLYPNLDRLQRILAALYARAPHGATPLATAATPIAGGEERSFVVDSEDAPTRERVVVDRVFPTPRPRLETPPAAPKAAVAPRGRPPTSPTRVPPPIPPMPPPHPELRQRPATAPQIARPPTAPQSARPPTAPHFARPATGPEVRRPLTGPEIPLLLTRPKEPSRMTPRPVPASDEVVVLLTKPKRKE
ncbi:MAG: hypothetical protein IT371_16080 [Deltaproteobacteria bacterium]|nr:hypothetical protein [Deltaproteobacteria bacterium]